MAGVRRDELCRTDVGGFHRAVRREGRSNLGNANAEFYKIAAGGNAGTAIHDITSGSNGAYSAGTGYDVVTGLGSYDGAGLAGALGG